MTGLIYGVNVLVWGFSWIAITVQVRYVPAETALLYRIVLAAVILFAVLWASGRLRPVVDRILPLREGREAQRILEAGEQFGKLVLEP